MTTGTPGDRCTVVAGGPAAVLAVTVVANVALLWKANSDPSFAVEPDYYQRAVLWDSTVAQRHRSDALHWRAAVRLAPPEGGEATILVTLTTQEGAPVDSADVRAEASHNAGRRRVSGAITRVGAGALRGADPLQSAGPLAGGPDRDTGSRSVRRAADARQRRRPGPMNALVLSVLGASLLGSPHCAAMCGGFVCFFSGSRPASRAGSPTPRTTPGASPPYASLGFAAAMAGAGFDLAGRMAGFQRPAAVAAGLLLILWGLAGLAAAAGYGRSATAAPAGFRRLFTSAIARLADKPPIVRALTVGLLTALLPCGWLYAFVATAASTGSGVSGALVMAAFWAGTVPVLAGVGALAQRAAGPLRASLPMLTAAMLVVLGVLTVAGKFQVPDGAQPVAPPSHGQHDHH